MKIRTANLKDADRIYELYKESALTNLGPYTQKQMDEWLNDRNPEKNITFIETKTVLVAEEDEKIIGFSQVNLDTTEIHACYVDKTFWKQGIGQTLLQATFAAAEKAGLQKVFLYAGITSEGFYHKVGFKTIKYLDYEFDNGIKIPVVEMEYLFSVITRYNPEIIHPLQTPQAAKPVY